MRLHKGLQVHAISVAMLSIMALPPMLLANEKNYEKFGDEETEVLDDVTAAKKQVDEFLANKDSMLFKIAKANKILHDALGSSNLIPTLVENDASDQALLTTIALGKSPTHSFKRFHSYLNSIAGGYTFGLTTYIIAKMLIVQFSCYSIDGGVLDRDSLCNSLAGPMADLLSIIAASTGTMLMNSMASIEKHEALLRDISNLNDDQRIELSNALFSAHPAGDV